MLIRCDGDTKIVPAYKSNIGWIANWHGLQSTNSILLPDGTTAGYKLIKNWLPHRGWDQNDFDKLKFMGLLGEDK